jgi:hypothetical protein
MFFNITDIFKSKSAREVPPWCRSVSRQFQSSLIMLSVTCVTSALRQRFTGEITPVRTEESRSYPFLDGYATDLELGTYTYAMRGSDGKSWLKVILDQVHCVDKVLHYFQPFRTTLNTWTCTKTACTCKGTSKYAPCSDFTVTVSTERAVPQDIPNVPDCGRGDTITLEKISAGDKKISVNEIVIIGKQGEIM